MFNLEPYNTNSVLKVTMGGENPRPYEALNDVMSEGDLMIKFAFH